MNARPTEMRYRRDLWKVCVPGDAAEIGVAEGNFAEEMLNWDVKFKTVYIIDRWEFMPLMKGDSSQSQLWHERNLRKVQSRCEKFGRRAEIMKMGSAEAAPKIPDGSLSFINIDADHSYEGVKADIESWWRKLAPLGVIAFHDYEQVQYGVKRAVQEFAKRNTFHVFLLPEDKREDAGAFLINPPV